MNVFIEGLLLQASLIFALGAQNIFVLECGLNRRHPLLVSFTCFLCDLTLIMLGVAGAATLITQYHQLKVLFGMLGILFMVIYGVGKIIKAPDIINASSIDSKSTLKKCVLLSITFSILNPHAYLDAFVLIGGFSTKYNLMSQRILLGLGAAIFSLIWFLFLSSASAIIKPYMGCPKRMKVVMSVSGFALLILAGILSADVYGWMVQMVEDPHCSIFGSCSPIISPSVVDLR